MAEAVFTPPSAPGAIAAAGFNAYGQGVSLMERATRMKQEQEMFEMQKEKFKVELPAIVAKARADEVSSKAAIAAKDQMENLRRNGAEASVKANEEYIGALAIPNWDEQAKVLSQIQAKYGWMSNVRDESGQPIYKGFLDTLDNSTANAYLRGQIDKTISGQMETQGNKSETQLEIAKARAETQQTLAQERATTQKEIAELKASQKMGPASQKFEEELGTTAAKYYNSVQEKTAEHQRTLDTIADNKRLIEAGAEQGVGENVKVAVMQGINALTRTAGTGDLFDTSKPEQLQRNYADFAVSAASRMKGQGQITENERKLLLDTVAKFGNSKKAALYIMDFMEGVAQREIEKASWLKSQRDERRMVGPEDEPQFYRENPLSFFIPTRSEGGDTDEVEKVLAKYRKSKPNG